MGTAWLNYKPKDLLGIPWAVAFALRADGWYLRSEIILAKRNPMPESVRDRPTRAHEQFFLLTKRPTYFYDSDAIREDDSGRPSGNGFVRDHRLSYQNADGTPRGNEEEWKPGGGRNKRSVWWVSSEPFAGAHFAVFGTKWIEPCILAGAPERACGECGAPWVRVTDGATYYEGDDGSRTRKTNMVGNGHGGAGRGPKDNLGASIARTLGFEPSCPHGDGSARGVVLDPFAGAGTTGLVALQHGRDFVGIELNPEYARMARERIETAVRLGFRPPSNGAVVPEGQDALF